jgi:oligosaccharide repeat unit polymerase
MVHLLFIIGVLGFYYKSMLKSKSLKFVLVAYSLSFLCGYFLELLDFDFRGDDWNYTSLFFIFVTLIISFRSLRSFDLYEYSANNKEPLLYKSVVLKIIVTLSVISSIIFFYDFVNFIKSPDLGAARLDHQLEEGESKGVVYSFFASISFCFHISLYLYFDLIIKQKQKIALLVLFGSFSYVFWVVSAFGRDGFVFWALSFFFYFILFNNKLSKTFKRKLRRVMLVFGTLFLILFYKISSSRFENHSNYNSNKNVSPVVLSILDYTGQQLKNLNTYYNMDIDHTYGLYNYSYVYRQFIGAKELKKRQEFVQLQIANNGKPHYNFAFFLKELWIDFGRFGTLLICVFYTLIINFLSKKGSFLRSNYLIYITYTQFLLMGLFYNKFYFPSANAFLILILVLVSIESLFYGKKKKSISNFNDLQ